MKVKKVFDPTHVEGKCAKQVVTMLYEGVVYTVVCDKSEYKTKLTPNKLRVYWNEGTDEDTGWGQHFEIQAPDHHRDDIVLLAEHAIYTLVNA